MRTVKLILKIQLYRQFDVDLVPPVSNFTKKKTLGHVVSCEFCNLFQFVTLLKTRL